MDWQQKPLELLVAREEIKTNHLNLYTSGVTTLLEMEGKWGGGGGQRIFFWEQIWAL